VTVSGNTASFRAVVTVGGRVTFARLQFTITDSVGGSVGAAGGTDGVTVTSARTQTGSRTLNGGAYSVALSYSLDGRSWVTGASVRFTVGSFDRNGVWLGVPTVSVDRAGNAVLTVKVEVNHPITFADLQIAVRSADGADIDGAGEPLDVAFHYGITVTSVITFSGGRHYDGGRFTAFAAYSFDETNWVNGPRGAFTAP
jgi:hypothetical protein